MTQTAARSELPVLDMTVLNDFKAELESVPQVIEKFMKSYPLTATRLVWQAKSAVTAGDTFQLLLAVHTLYAPSATLGLMQIANLCRELEKIVRGLPVGTAGSLVPIVGAKLTELDAAFKKGIAALKQQS